MSLLNTAIGATPPQSLVISAASDFLDISPLLMSPSPISSTFSKPLNASIPIIQCFTNPETHPVLRRIVVNDYYETLQKIMIEDGAMTPRQWDNPPRRSVQAMANQVIIAMNSPRPRSLQVFQPILIARAAASIADKCLREKTGYFGGQTFLGSGGAYFRRPLVNDRDSRGSLLTNWGLCLTVTSAGAKRSCLSGKRWLFGRKS